MSVLNRLRCMEDYVSCYKYIRRQSLYFMSNSQQSGFPDRLVTTSKLCIPEISCHNLLTEELVAPQPVGRIEALISMPCEYFEGRYTKSFQRCSSKTKITSPTGMEVFILEANPIQNSAHTKPYQFQTSRLRFRKGSEEKPIQVQLHG